MSPRSRDYERLGVLLYAICAYTQRRHYVLPNTEVDLAKLKNLYNRTLKQVKPLAQPVTSETIRKKLRELRSYDGFPYLIKDNGRTRLNHTRVVTEGSTACIGLICLVLGHPPISRKTLVTSVERLFPLSREEIEERIKHLILAGYLQLHSEREAPAYQGQLEAGGRMLNEEVLFRLLCGKRDEALIEDAVKDNLFASEGRRPPKSS